MAIMPGAEWRPVSDGNSRLSMARYDIVCVHTLVGYALGGSAAHWSTRWDGYTYQWRDTKNQSAANLYGNPRVLSIENEDHGSAFGNWNVNDGHAVPSLTPQQCEAIANICAWANKVHGIPLVLCPDSKPGSRGIAYHRQGCDSDNNFAGYAYPGRVSGGEMWTTAKGKVCPGDRRIKQLIEVIIPRARVLAGLDKEAPTVSIHEVLPCKPDGTGTTTVAIEARWNGANFRTVNAKLATIETKVDALAGTLSDDEANLLAAIRAEREQSAEAIAAHLSELINAAGVVTHLSDEDVQRVVDEHDRRARERANTEV